MDQAKDISNSSMHMDHVLDEVVYDFDESEDEVSMQIMIPLDEVGRVGWSS